MASTAASTCPASTGNWGDKSFASAWNWPSTFGGNFPSTFAGNSPMNFGGNYPMNFGGNYPMNTPMNFGSNWPSTFGGNYGSFPSGWNWPSTFGGNYGSFPSGWNSPSTFGGNYGSFPSSWTDKNRFNSCIRDAVFRPASMAEFWTFSNPIHVNAFDGSRMLYLCFDVKGFKPEECKVEFTPKDRCITVTAAHDVKDKEHTVTRNYQRKYVVPTDFCADLSKCELKCHYTFDGLLVIEGFLPKMTAEELKALKEKTPSKLSAMTGAFCPAGFSGIESTFGCAIPIKTN